ncbi:MAG: hypothetical protein KGI70_03350 [Patescibacteria group bacterium]|nr:hypothetical protein [Patescibacteria group bacterium]
MSPSECVERWQNTVLHSIERKLKLDPAQPKFQNSAELTGAAIEAFKEACAAARTYDQNHLGEDREMRHATMAHIFELIGVLPLDAVRLVEDLFPT